MEAQHHLADGAAVHEDKPGNLALGILRQEKLAVQGESVFALENYLLGRYQRRRRKVSRQRLLGNHFATMRPDFIGHRWGCSCGAQTNNVLAIPDLDRRPLDALAARQGLWRRSAGCCYAPQVPAVNVALI